MDTASIHRGPTVVGFVPPTKVAGPVVITNFGARGSLADVLRAIKNGQPPSWFKKTTIIKWMFQAIQQLWVWAQSGMVHREIKPSDFIIDANGNLYLVDYFTSILEELYATHASQVGAPSYMAPEVYDDRENEKKVRDPKIDIFSFGLVVFEMLSGVRMFSECTSAATIMRMAGNDSAYNNWFGRIEACIHDENARAAFNLYLFCMFSDIFRPCVLSDPRKRPTCHELLIQFCMRAISIMVSWPLDDEVAELITQLSTMLSLKQFIIATTLPNQQLSELSKDANCPLSQHLKAVFTAQPSLALWGGYFGMQMAFHGLRFADSELAKFCVPMKPTQAQPGEAARAPDGAPASGHWLDGISAVAYTRLAADYSASEDMPWEPPQFGYSEASTQLFQKDLLKWVTWLPAQFKLRAGTPPVMNPAAAMKLQEVMGAMEQHCCAFALQVSKRNRLARQIQRDTAVLEEAIRDAQARGRPAEPRRAPSAEQMSQLRELLRRIGEEREPGEE